METLQALWEETITGLNDRPWRELSLPTEFHCAVRQERQGELRLQTRFQMVPGYGELRGVLITAAKIDILLQFFFPEPRCRLPIYAMELVLLTRPIIGVLDVVDVLTVPDRRAPSRQLLQQAHVEFADLPSETTLPDWYHHCRSGDDFFVRPHNNAMMMRLHDLHRHLWRGYRQLWSAPVPLAEQQIPHHRAALQAYKHHQRQHSPGLPLLRRSFGAEWAEQYLGFFFG